MADEQLARRLTQEEFEQLLQRAVDRQEVKASRAFTVDELVEAGQELGIDAQTVEQVYREHQRELMRPPGRQRPFDSKLALSKQGDTFSLTIPPKPGTKVIAAIQTVALTAVTGGLIGIGAPGPMVAGAGLLALGFGYFGFSLARTVRELRLRRDGSGLLIRFRGRGKGKGIPLLAGQVHARLAERVVGTKNASRRIPFLALDHGTDTHELLEDYTHAELAWAVEEIERWLGR